MTTSNACSSAGTALFVGNAWLPRPLDQPAAAVATHLPPALWLDSPLRILQAHRVEDVSPLLAEVQREQERGRYVAGYLAYEAGAAFGLPAKAAPTARPEVGRQSNRFRSDRFVPHTLPLA